MSSCGLEGWPSGGSGTNDDARHGVRRCAVPMNWATPTRTVPREPTRTYGTCSGEVGSRPACGDSTTVTGHDHGGELRASALYANFYGTAGAESSRR